MSHQRKLLLETLQGHIALLGETHPRKAATLVARRARSYVRQNLRTNASVKRVAA